ncbi:MAG: nuclear transport factor 2 family protein [Haloferacaceae archaeon]
MSTTRDVLEHHLDAFGEQDLEEVMADYVEESVVVTNMGTYRGLDEIEGLFEDLFADFGQAGSEIAVDQREIEGDVAYIVWHGETPDNVYAFATDTFVVEDGAIVTQTFAGQVEAKD